ncbi:MAG: 30S ribosomal protein S15 [Epsilonproteobacteria bacterium]|nr:MAG: 30S ribosomal protein S15 [Campylobacterota bacterium]RLA67119.1 MAG: 30S ribosomal protein S15 [Campylobacterota bacterium]
MITKEDTALLTKQYGKNEKDSGSTPVQIAILTKRINNLMPHFEKHIHDYHSNRGLLKLIGQRRSLLKYYAKTDADKYGDFIKSLGLRK